MWREVKILIIDEISFMSNSKFLKLDRKLEALRDNTIQLRKLGMIKSLPMIFGYRVGVFIRRRHVTGKTIIPG